MPLVGESLSPILEFTSQLEIDSYHGDFEPPSDCKSASKLSLGKSSSVLMPLLNTRPRRLPSVSPGTEEPPATEGACLSGHGPWPLFSRAPLGPLLSQSQHACIFTRGLPPLWPSACRQLVPPSSSYPIPLNLVESKRELADSTTNGSRANRGKWKQI
jgi:hypothetical protein